MRIYWNKNAYFSRGSGFYLTSSGDHKDYSWIDEQKIRGFLLASKENLLSDDPVLKRKVIETFVQEIVIYPDDGQ